MMIKPPASVISEWLDMCGQWRCVATGAAQIQLHHVAGRTFKVNKVQIGELFILPLWYVLHDASSNHKYNVTHHRHAFVKKYGRQCDLFKAMIDGMRSKGWAIPFDEFYIDLIMQTGR